MCNADSDVARWLIHTHPTMLQVEDAQRDTPVSIALKECAYYLLKYGNDNNGYLDDGTTYSDDDTNKFYPEINKLRELVAVYGEYDKVLTHSPTHSPNHLLTHSLT